MPSLYTLKYKHFLLEKLAEKMEMNYFLKYYYKILFIN